MPNYYLIIKYCYPKGLNITMDTKNYLVRYITWKESQHQG